MDTKKFRELLKVYFKPRMNELGFNGSNHHFVKKTDSHFIYTFVIQANKYGGSCIMEMGVTLDFLYSDKKISSLTVYDSENS